MNRLRILTITVCLLLTQAPAFAQLSGLFPGSHFESEVRWLANNATPEADLDNAMLPEGVRDRPIDRNFAPYADQGLSPVAERSLPHYADVRTPRVGEQVVFNVPNLVSNRSDRVSATLKAVGKHCYVFVAGGRVTDANVAKIAGTFDERIYPLSTQLFGREWSPGIDRDPRITLLLVDIKDGYNGNNGAYTTGFFYAVDEYPKSKNQNSNEREMVYLDTWPTNPGDPKYLAVLAHEFQHMIHWRHDPKEHDWVNEGMSQLSQFVNGFDHPEQVFNFVNDSDNNMLAWSNDNVLANYGQVYLFMYYLMSHTVKSVAGQKSIIRFIVESKKQGTAGINESLTKAKVNKTFARLFRDFCVANFINDRRAHQGAFGYDPNLGMLLLSPMRTHNQAPYAGHGTVKLWSSRAVRVGLRNLPANIRVSFQGDKLSAGNSTNSYDVAVAFLDSTRKTPAKVSWLPIKAFRGQATFQRPSQAHDQLSLIVVNRGPEGARIELPFAKAAGSAKFSYSVTPSSSATSVARTTSTSRSSSALRTANKSRSATRTQRASNSTSKRPTRSVTELRQMLVAVADRPSLQQEATRVFSEDPQIQASVQGLGVHSSLEHYRRQDEEIVEAVREALEDDNVKLAEEFFTYFAGCSAEKKAQLHGIRRQLLDIIHFEINQGSRPELKSLLE